MLGYGVFASAACACPHAPSATTSAKVPNAIVLTNFRFIDFLLQYGVKLVGGEPTVGDV
jgi:hypothetical protein